MSGTIANGYRAAVSFGAFTGQAGVQEAGSATTVAFFGDAATFTAGSEGTIDGEPWRVLRAEPSGGAQPRLRRLGTGRAGVPGMVVLTVERAGA